MKVGLYFGSFNPVHIGHLAIANYALSFTDLEEVWFVVSPQSPFKKEVDLLPQQIRLELIRKSLRGNPSMKACDMEFYLPKPSYTADSLRKAEIDFPGNTWVILMGADGLVDFNQWKEHQWIAEHYRRYIYPRPGIKVNKTDCSGCLFLEAPLMEISSSFIRNSLREGRNVDFFLPEAICGQVISLFQNSSSGKKI